MIQYVDSVRIAFDTVGTVDVSTVRLPRLPDGQDVYETCLFYKGFSSSSSEVISRYDSRSEAKNGHQMIVATLQFVLDK